MPKLASKLHPERVEFLDKEHFTDIPEGSRRELDLLANVPADFAEDRLIFIHVEIEGEASSVMAKRLWRHK